MEHLEFLEAIGQEAEASAEMGGRILAFNAVIFDAAGDAQ